MKAAEKLLGDYQGIIVCDGYAVYEALAGRKPNIVLAFCWSHARRKYKDIKEFFPKDTEKIVDLIDKLFEIDRRAPGDDAEALQERAHLRDTLSRPTIDEIKQSAIDVKTLPKSGLADAIAYMTNHWSGLVRFLDDPRIPCRTTTRSGQTEIQSLGERTTAARDRCAAPKWQLSSTRFWRPSSSAASIPAHTYNSR